MSLQCPMCGEGLRPTGLHCPTCSAEVGWWLLYGEKAQGPYELRDLKELIAAGEFDRADWLVLGSEGLRQRPEVIAELLRGVDGPPHRLFEDWVDVRNLVRLVALLLTPLLVLFAIFMWGMWLGWWKH